MKSSRIAAVALVSSLGGGLVATAAGATFNDVPSESQFAEHIESVQEAGIATGFPDGTFRPTNALNRQQAAAWIDRSASRTGFDLADLPSEHTPLTPSSPDLTLATLEMSSPATSAGGGWVNIQGFVATATANAHGAGCPCAVDIKVLNSADEVVALSALTTPGPESDDERAFAGPVGVSPVTATVFLPGGSTETYRLVVTLQDSDVEAVYALGTLAGDYAPMADGEPAQLIESGGADAPASLAPGQH
jgi:hypothetical protein